MSGARDLAGAARRLLSIEVPKGAASAALDEAAVTLRYALERWDAAGNPARLEHADQRLRYLETLEAFLDASGTMAVGAFANDELAGRAIALRSALSVHLDESASMWDVDRGRDE